MSALTVRLPDDKLQRLRALAESRGADRTERGLALLAQAAGADPTDPPAAPDTPAAAPR